MKELLLLIVAVALLIPTIGCNFADAVASARQPRPERVIEGEAAWQLADVSNAKQPAPPAPPKPDPGSEPAAKQEAVAPPKLDDLLDAVNADQNTKLEPNPSPAKPSGAKKPATGSQCGPNGCGSPRRAGLFGRWRG